MKAKFIKLSGPDQQSFSVKNERVSYFYNPYHYHPELELTLVQKGMGTRFIGDNIEPFFEGDLVLVGANLPHLWRCSNDYYHKENNLISQAIVIHFTPVVWGDRLLGLPEMRLVRGVLDEAQRGIRITGVYRDFMDEKIAGLLSKTGAERLLTLFSILESMALCPDEDKRLLSSGPFIKSQREQDAERIHRVYQYTLTHFKTPITLNEIADVANLNRTSFCRYFRTRTRKSFWQVLIEIRIGHACKLLIGDTIPVAQIALECGYNSVSVFNEHFKRITGITPLNYQKSYCNQPI